MLAEELQVVDADATSWQAVRPLLTVATRLEQDETYVWHGWSKGWIATFLQQLPTHCTLVAGVWSVSEEKQLQEQLVLSCICEVAHGEVRSVRTFAALQAKDIPAIEDLEPGFEDAAAILRVVTQTIAPVAWAIFTDKETWDEWVYMGNERVEDKAELLVSLARQGRCVLMGSQTHHSAL